MTPKGPSPNVALFGQGALELAQDVSSALAELMPQYPSPAWHVCFRADESLGASLRWLLSWDETNQETPEQEIAALQAHQAQRRSLHALGLDYQVLRGKRQERIMQALYSLSAFLPALVPLLPQTGVISRRSGLWSCEACCDPDCERRSFTALVAQPEDFSM